MNKRFEKYYDSYYADQHVAIERNERPFTQDEGKAMMYKAWQAGRRYGHLERDSGGWSFAITRQVNEKFHEEINELYTLSLQAMEAQIKKRVEELLNE